MTRSVQARYEHGVLTPLSRVDIPEGATVQVTIVPVAWEKKFRALLAKVHAKTRRVPPGQIEAAITRASEEVRAKRLKSR